MDIGMLWFDDTPSMNITEKVIKAASYYASKYGRKPNVCFVHPGMLTQDNLEPIGGIEIKASRTIMRHHYWLGIQQTHKVN